MIHLKRLTIRGFGTLCAPEAPVEFPADRVSLIVGRNEVGKTTLAQALFASLYATQHRANVKNTALPHEKQWRPRGADGGAFGLSLQIETDDLLLRADWDFDARTLRVTDERTGKDLTEDYHAGRNTFDLGARLTGLSDVEFRKVCYVAQSELTAGTDLANIAGLVQRYAATSPGEGVTAAEACDAIERVMRLYPLATQGKTLNLDNEIERLQDGLEAIRGELAGIEAKQRDAASDEEEYERLVAKEQTLTAELAGLRARHSVAELRELDRKMAEADAAEQRLIALTAERDKLAHLADFPADEERNLNRLDADLQALTTRAADMQRAVDDLAPVIDTRRRDTAAHGLLAQAAEDDLRAAETLAVRVGDAARRHRSLSEQRDREHAALAAGDTLPAELAALQRELASLSDAAREQAAEYSVQRARLQERLNDAQERFTQTGQRLGIAKRAGRVRHRIGATLLAVGVLLAAAGLTVRPLATIAPWLPGTGVLAGILAFMLGLGLRLWPVRRPGDPDELAAELAAADQERADVQKATRDLRESMERNAQACGAPTVEILSQKARRLVELDRKTADWRALDEQCRASEESLRAVAADARALAQRFTRPLAGNDLPAEIESLARDMRRAMNDAQALRYAESQRDDLGKDHAQIKKDIAACVASIRQIFAQAHIDTTDIAEGIASFVATLEQHARLKTLDEDIIPREQARVPDAATRRDWADRAQQLRARAGQPDDAPGESAAKIADRADSARRELADAADARRDLGARIQTQLADCRSREGDLRARRTELHAALVRAERHRAALQMALDELHAAAADAHRVWADELNRRVDEHLEAFSPNLTRLRFDDDLSFTVIEKGSDPPVPTDDIGPELSVGQRDQLFLAVRLGIADFLAGRDCAPPIILDDPFVNFDDDRFALTVRFLAERVLPRRQILLLTCHRQRFEWLRAQDADWFDAHFSRVSVPGDA